MTAKRYEYIIGEFWDNLSDEPLSCSEIEKKINALDEKNKQLEKQIKVYEYFLEQNDLDIDWNCLCTADECYIQEDIDFDCKDCKYMELIE